MQVGFYGGSFDPPHMGHVLAVTCALMAGGFERVLVVPVYGHAFEKYLTPFVHRLRMCQLAMGWLPGVDISDVEESLDVPNLTLMTLRKIRAENPDYRLRLIVGSDVLEDATKWHAFEEVKRIAAPFVLGRAGYDHPDAIALTLPRVSSGQVKDLLTRRSDPDAERQLAALVPAKVLAYVEEHGLYR